MPLSLRRIYLTMRRSTLRRTHLAASIADSRQINREFLTWVNFSEALTCNSTTTNRILVRKNPEESFSTNTGDTAHTPATGRCVGHKVKGVLGVEGRLWIFTMCVGATAHLVEETPGLAEARTFLLKRCRPVLLQCAIKPVFGSTIKTPLCIGLVGSCPEFS